MCNGFSHIGWHDGTTGPLIPVIQRDFKVGCIASFNLLYLHAHRLTLR